MQRVVVPLKSMFGGGLGIAARGQRAGIQAGGSRAEQAAAHQPYELLTGLVSGRRLAIAEAGEPGAGGVIV